MANETGYAVIKFVTGNGHCHRGSDYVKGRLLAEFFRERPQIGKVQLLQWIKQINKLLEQYHNGTSDNYYRYVNPYMIVIDEDGKLSLLDPNTESNQNLIQQSQSKSIRRRFLPPDEPGYRKGSLQLDIYGLGRTIQFILAHAVANPKLTKYEEHKFQKVIQRCLNYNSKKPYSNVSQILKHYPTPLVKQTPLLRLGLSILAALIGIFILCSNTVQSSPEVQSVQTDAAKDQGSEKQGALEQGTVEQGTTEQEAVEQTEDELFLELGYIYLSDLNKPKESQVYFSQISDENQVAGCYERIAGYLQNQATLNSETELEAELANAESLLNENATLQDLRIWLRAYMRLDTPTAHTAIIRIGEMALEQHPEKEVEIEIRELLGEAYKEAGEKEKAVEKYQQLKQMMVLEKQEQIYEAIIGIYEELGNTEAAINECVEGAEKMVYSYTLKMRHIRLLCQQETADQQACVDLIRKYITAQPELKEQEEFIQLQNECGIKVEGDNIWLERE